jgi:hypothetical protein
MTDQTVVLAAYPTARADQRAPRHVAIMAITRIDGRRTDNLIGSGTTEAQAWQCAAERVREDNAA